GPAAFRDHLRTAATLARAGARRDDAAARERFIAQHHASALRMLAYSWALIGRRLGLAPDLLAFPASVPAPPAPPALRAAPIAASKAAAEMPVLRRTMRPDDAPAQGRIPWPRLAVLYQPQALLDDASRALIRSKHPMSWDASGSVRPM